MACITVEGGSLAGQLVVLEQAKPRFDKDKNQRRDPDTGMPLWGVACMLIQDGGTDSERISLTVPGVSSPTEAAGLRPLQPVEVSGLRVEVWPSKHGSMVSFKVDAIRGVA